MERFSEVNFGPLEKYIKDDEVTDIDFKHGKLWVGRTDAVPYEVNEPEVTDEFINKLILKLAQVASVNFNGYEPILLFDIGNLRITCLHERLSLTGATLCIRKSLFGFRFTKEQAIENGYASKEVFNMLINCVKAGKNFVFCGEPGNGKTEALRFFSSYIPAYKTVVTIEDTLEIHYPEINPEKSCVAFKAASDTYEKIIATTLRINPSWIFFGECRSREARYLLETWSNNISSMTTLHVNDTENVPDRLLNMLETVAVPQLIVNQIYTNAGVVVLIEKMISEDGSVKRRIKQVRLYYRSDGENVSALVVDDGKLYKERFPEFIRQQIEKRTGCGLYDSLKGEV